MTVLFALTLSATMLVSADPPLVPETLPDWRPERLDFPLEFAPDLDLEGYEELRFAPGMFDPNDPTYFTYVFGIDAENDVEVDGAFVEKFLTSYYTGLCRAVAESRGLDIDLSAISIDIEPMTGRHVDATIAMFDVFGDGSPLALQFEMDVRGAEGTTEMFAIVSPAAKDADIWETLEAAAARWRADRAVAPGWFDEHLAAMTDGTGRWVTDNTAYRSDAEPFARYVLECRLGLGNRSLIGQMVGVGDDGNEVPLNEFRTVWHPGLGAGVVHQFNGDGMLATGTLAPMKGDVIRAIQMFYFTDGSELRIRHDHTKVGDGMMRTKSFIRSEGTWQPNRTYEWRLDD